ncbi:hypothetical protein Ancab_000938 [Ancistrocladus abbreviatus]
MVTEKIFGDEIERETSTTKLRDTTARCNDDILAFHRVFQTAVGPIMNSINSDPIQEQNGPVNSAGANTLNDRPKAACVSIHGPACHHHNGQVGQRPDGHPISSSSSATGKTKHDQGNKRRGNCPKMKPKQKGRIQSIVKLAYVHLSCKRLISGAVFLWRCCGPVTFQGGSCCVLGAGRKDVFLWLSTVARGVELWFWVIFVLRVVFVVGAVVLFWFPWGLSPIFRL